MDKRSEELKEDFLNSATYNATTHPKDAKLFYQIAEEVFGEKLNRGNVRITRHAIGPIAFSCRLDLMNFLDENLYEALKRYRDRTSEVPKVTMSIRYRAVISVPDEIKSLK